MKRVSLNLGQGLNLSQSDLALPFKITRLPLWPEPGLNWALHPGHVAHGFQPLGNTTGVVAYDPSGFLAAQTPDGLLVADLFSGTSATGGQTDGVLLPQAGWYRSRTEHILLGLAPSRSIDIQQVIPIQDGQLEAGDYVFWAITYLRHRLGLLFYWYSAAPATLSNKGGFRILLSQSATPNSIVKVYVQRRVPGGAFAPPALIAELTSGREVLYTNHEQEGAYEVLAFALGSGKLAAYWGGRYFYTSDRIVVLGSAEREEADGDSSGLLFVRTASGFAVYNSDGQVVDTLPIYEAWDTAFPAEYGQAVYIALRSGGKTYIYRASNSYTNWDLLHTIDQEITFEGGFSGSGKVVFISRGQTLVGSAAGNGFSWSLHSNPITGPIRRVFSWQGGYGVLSNRALYFTTGGESWQTASPPGNFSPQHTLWLHCNAWGSRIHIMAARPDYPSSGDLSLIEVVYENGTWTSHGVPDANGVRQSNLVARRFAYVLPTQSGLTYAYGLGNKDVFIGPSGYREYTSPAPSATYRLVLDTGTNLFFEAGNLLIRYTEESVSTYNLPSSRNIGPSTSSFIAIQNRETGAVSEVPGSTTYTPQFISPGMAGLVYNSNTFRYVAVWNGGGGMRAFPVSAPILQSVAGVKATDGWAVAWSGQGMTYALAGTSASGFRNISNPNGLLSGVPTVSGGVIYFTAGTSVYAAFVSGGGVRSAPISGSVVGLANDGASAFVATTGALYRANINPNSLTLVQVYTPPSGTTISGLANGNGEILIGLSNGDVLKFTNSASQLFTLPSGHVLRYGAALEDGSYMVLTRAAASPPNTTEMSGAYRFAGGNLTPVFVPSTATVMALDIPVGGLQSSIVNDDRWPIGVANIRLPANTVVWTEPGYLNRVSPFNYAVFVPRSSHRITALTPSPSGVLVWMDNEVHIIGGRLSSLADTRITQYPSRIGLDANTVPANIGAAMAVIWGGRIHIFSEGESEWISLPVDDGTPFVGVAYHAKHQHLVALKADGRVLRLDLQRKAWFTDGDRFDLLLPAPNEVYYLRDRVMYRVREWNEEPGSNYIRPAQEIWIDAFRSEGESIKRLRSLHLNIKAAGPINGTVRVYNEHGVEAANVPLFINIAGDMLGLGNYRATFPPVVSYAPSRIVISFAGAHFTMAPEIVVGYEARNRRV